MAYPKITPTPKNQENFYKGVRATTSRNAKKTNCDVPMQELWKRPPLTETPVARATLTMSLLFSFLR